MPLNNNDGAGIIWGNLSNTDWVSDYFEDEQFFRLREDLERTAYTASAYGVVQGYTCIPNYENTPWVVRINPGLGYDKMGRRVSSSTAYNLTVGQGDVDKFIIAYRSYDNVEPVAEIFTGATVATKRQDVTIFSTSFNPISDKSIRLAKIVEVSESGQITLSQSSSNRDLWSSLCQGDAQIPEKTVGPFTGQPVSNPPSSTFSPANLEDVVRVITNKISYIMTDAPDDNTWRTLSPSKALSQVYTKSSVDGIVATHASATGSTVHGGVIKEVIDARGGMTRLADRLNKSLDAEGNIIQGRILEQLTSYNLVVPACMSFYVDTVASGLNNYGKVKFPTRIRVLHTRIQARSAPSADITFRLTDGTHNLDVVLPEGATYASNDASVVFEVLTGAEDITFKVDGGEVSSSTIYANVTYVYRYEPGE